MKDNGQAFETLLAQAREAYEEGPESDTYWAIVWLLANRGDEETLAQVVPLTGGDAIARSFAASVLGPFAPRIDFEPDDIIEIPRRFASTEITDILLQMLVVEKEERVIDALVSSLGQHRDNDPRIPAAIGRFVQHPSTDIRWSIAVGLGSYETPEASELLLRLSADKDSGVRDWATFGLARHVSIDSPSIRSALVARLSDQHAEIRLKAIEGLALRHDPHVVTAFLQEFEDPCHWERLFLVVGRLQLSFQEMTAAPDYQGDRKQAQAAVELCEEILNYFAAPLEPPATSDAPSKTT